MFTCLDLGLDLTFQLSKIEHELINFARPNGEALCLEVETILGTLLEDSLFAPLVGDRLPPLEEALHFASVDAVTSVRSLSILDALL